MLGSGLVTVMDRFRSDGCSRFVRPTKRIRWSRSDEQCDLKNGKNRCCFGIRRLLIVSINVHVSYLGCLNLTISVEETEHAEEGTVLASALLHTGAI